VRDDIPEQLLMRENLSMKYVLGIDQGHTETRAVVCNLEGSLLGVGKTLGACHSVHGMAQAMHTIQTAAQIALDQAGVGAQDIVALFCGLTGADWPDEYELLHENVMKLGLGQKVWIKNDTIVALRGGTLADYGAIVIAGTGSNCAIRSPRGEEFIYHFYHDYELQGGIALGRRALNAIYRAETGRSPATLLKGWVLDMFDVASVDDLLRANVEGRLGKDRIKHIAPLVFQAACEGDWAAGQILRAFGEGLAELVTAGLRRFEMTALDVEVVLSGNIFKGRGSLLQEVMLASIHMVAPRARLVNARYEPVVGALLLGLEVSGIAIDEQARQNIERTCQDLGLIRVQG
jgi:N-acetylglucosamine kinase-like BadF-type ATPase